MLFVTVKILALVSIAFLPSYSSFNRFPNVLFRGASVSLFALNPVSANKMSGNDVKGWVDGLIKKHQIVVFAKSYCPYCVSAIDAIRGLNPDDLHVENIEDNKHCTEIQDYLGSLTGARSVPRVFLGGKFFGDSTFTVGAIQNGTFAHELKKLKKADL
ncbi:glutaredoxin-1, grx1, putative [Theileria equi strain WA]|uniref:Glutaredoxin-1 n=1 Tax=Theileria equi strain WA TaxID=1537102 RepID=L0AXH1_THEEQ|nr:glutaredoxin-1, grx1, putative [Theileria equi strain WA]AFZ80272.1 glutaredoxin-1, grx1, putative [Theileria equi strain WA]|eukprot:XP_004829938.1 glutaredoxin-1, grx1, putative [Theileria equi strain WA]